MTIIGKLWGAVSGAATGGWATIISTVAQLALVIAEAVRDKQLLDAGRAQANAEYSGEALERVNEANRARISAADDGVFVDPFDAANRRGVPDAPADPVRQPDNPA